MEPYDFTVIFLYLAIFHLYDKCLDQSLASIM